MASKLNQSSSNLPSLHPSSNVPVKTSLPSKTPIKTQASQNKPTTNTVSPPLQNKAYKNSSDNNYRPQTSPLYSMEKLLETTRDPGNILFKMLDNMREARHSSEQQIQKTMLASSTTEENPEVPLTSWKAMFANGNYITLQKDGNKLKGREIQIERHLQGVRRTIMDLKFERRHPGRIIKHLTNVDVDPSLLAQPQFTALDTSPEHIAKEASRKKTFERQNSYNLNVDSGLDDFKISSTHITPVEENSYVMSYNKEQLKKLKDGLTHVSRHMAKYKSPKPSNRSQTLDARSESIKEIDEDQSSENAMSDQGGESGDFSLKRKKKLKTSLFRRDAAARAKLDGQIIIPFEKSLNPKEEFLRVLGMTEKTRSSSNKLGFFLLEKNMGKARKSLISGNLNGIESEFQSPGSPKWINTQGSDDNHNTIESFYVTGKQNVAVTKSSDAGNSVNKMFGGSNHKDLRVLTSNVLDKRPTLGSRSTLSRKDLTREISTIDETNEDLKRYKQLSVDCMDNVKSTTTIQTTIEKSFGKLHDVLSRISDGITTPNAEVDNRIKDEILTYMKNPLFVLPGYRKKPKAKPGRNNRGE